MLGRAFWRSLRRRERSVCTERVLVSCPETGCFVALYDGVLPDDDAARTFVALRDSLPWQREKDDFGEQDRRSFFAADEGCTFRYVGLTLPPPTAGQVGFAGGWVPVLASARAAANTAARAALAGHCTRAWLGGEADAGTPGAKLVRAVQRQTGQERQPLLSACLINNYERGEGFIPWHYDEIRAHGEVKLIATVSLGSERTFELRRRVRQEDGGPATWTGDGDDQLLVGGGGGGVESVCAARDSSISVRLKPGSLLVMAGEVQSHWLHSLPLPEPRDDSNHRISLTFRSIVPGFEEDLARVQVHETSNCVD